MIGRLLTGPALYWVKYRIGIRKAYSQTTEDERRLLTEYVKGKRALVEIGVCQGLTTGALRRAMADDGVIYAIDHYRPNRIGVNFHYWIAKREVGKVSRGRCEFIKKTSHDAVVGWDKDLDFLFIDGDHSWDGIDHDWNNWSKFVVPGGIVALHDTRPAPHMRPELPDLDSVRYMAEVISKDDRFEEIDHVDSLTILRRKAS